MISDAATEQQQKRKKKDDDAHLTSPQITTRGLQVAQKSLTFRVLLFL